jgi:hypothetical protein
MKADLGVILQHLGMDEQWKQRTAAAQSRAGFRELAARLSHALSKNLCVRRRQG